jgi:hypothetical protein
VLGTLVVVAGGYVGAMAVRLLLSPPTPTDLATLPGAPAGGTAVVGSVALRPGPLPAVLGAGLRVGAGVALAVADRRLPRVGGRYAARPEQETADPDRAAWEALDAGVDPTAEAGDAGPGRSGRGMSDGPV